MIYPLGDTPIVNADYLVTHKGDMSVELWNDRAQCVLAHLTATARSAERERDTARAQVETLVEALREIIANTRCAGPGSCNSYGICAACTSESFARAALKAVEVGK